MKNNVRVTANLNLQLNYLNIKILINLESLFLGGCFKRVVHRTDWELISHTVNYFGSILLAKTYYSITKPMQVNCYQFNNPFLQVCWNRHQNAKQHTTPNQLVQVISSLRCTCHSAWSAVLTLIYTLQVLHR